MTLSNFVAELHQRGFDGFNDADLIRYINFGYRTVGRLTKWAWEETSIIKTMNPGEYRWTFETDLATIKSVRSVVCSTSTFEQRLTSMSSDDFYDNWAGYDLTSSQKRGEPDRYYLDGAYLYVLPPPNAIRDYVISGERYLLELETGVNETLITPEEYDEAILIAAEEHCHIRARQPRYADVNRKKLTEFFEDALVDENTRSQDAPSRVIAGRQTL